MKYTLDATNKKVGRVATQAAVFLMGKNTGAYARNAIPEVTVEITNAGKASIADTKMKQETYARYSGYPGGLRKLNMEKVISQKGHKEIFRVAVSGMLPKNKLRTKMMANLIITD